MGGHMVESLFDFGFCCGGDRDRGAFREERVGGVLVIIAEDVVPLNGLL
jgi:hypothetical protein